MPRLDILDTTKPTQDRLDALDDVVQDVTGRAREVREESRRLRAEVAASKDRCVELRSELREQCVRARRARTNQTLVSLLPNTAFSDASELH